jgi:hypothetical protein
MAALVAPDEQPDMRRGGVPEGHRGAPVFVGLQRSRVSHLSFEYVQVRPVGVAHTAC